MDYVGKINHNLITNLNYIKLQTPQNQQKKTTPIIYSKIN